MSSGSNNLYRAGFLEAILGVLRGTAKISDVDSTTTPTGWIMCEASKSLCFMDVVIGIWNSQQNRGRE